MSEFVWDVDYKALLNEAARRLSTGQFVPRFDADGVPIAPFLLPLGSAPAEVWKHGLVLDEPFWLLERASER